MQFATAKIGVILANLNPAYRTSEVEYALNQSGCRWLIAAPSFKTSDYRAMIEELRPTLATLERDLYFWTQGWDDNHFAGTVRGLEIRLKDLVGRTSQDHDVARLLKHLSREQGAVLTFLYRPGMHATNCKAETGTRPAVVNPKVWGGNRTNRGADTQQILMTIFRTALQQGHDIIATFTDLLLSPTPSVAPFTGLTHHPTG